MSATLTIGAWLQRLQQQGLPRLEAQMLLLRAAGQSPQDRAWLLAHDDQVLSMTQVDQLTQHVERRLQGEPMAYILGHKDFHRLRLRVDARVLDPRDDTETLVDWALHLGATLAPWQVLDLGTGSGAIALALAHERPTWRVTACDLSAGALEVAQANAVALDLTVRWVHGSWFEPFHGQRFDLIVSNPPYIPDNDPHLERLQHEPRAALVSGADGLDDLRGIVRQSVHHLQVGGWLLLEHGHDQAASVRQLLADAGFAQITSRRDLAGMERCSGGQWRPEQGFASREII
jgi:release factor glutamine methyltransferase